MVGESFPNEQSESPRKLVLLVIALVIFHVGAFVSSYAMYILLSLSLSWSCVLWLFYSLWSFVEEI